MIDSLNILFISLPVHGHVNPSLGLVRELVRRGHRVSYILTESYRDKVEAAGGVLLPYLLEFDLDTLALSLGNVKRPYAGSSPCSRASIRWRGARSPALTTWFSSERHLRFWQLVAGRLRPSPPVGDGPCCVDNEKLDMLTIG